MKLPIQCINDSIVNRVGPYARTASAQSATLRACQPAWLGTRTIAACSPSPCDPTGGRATGVAARDGRRPGQGPRWAAAATVPGPTRAAPSTVNRGKNSQRRGLSRAHRVARRLATPGHRGHCWQPPVGQAADWEVRNARRCQWPNIRRDPSGLERWYGRGTVRVGDTAAQAGSGVRGFLGQVAVGRVSALGRQLLTLRRHRTRRSTG